MKSTLKTILLCMSITTFACAQSNLPANLVGKPLAQIASNPTPADNDIMLGATADNFWRITKWGDARKAIASRIVPVAVTYIPPVSGNINNLNRYVRDPNGDVWFIDILGKAIMFPNGIQSISLSGNNLILSKGGGTVTLPLASYTAGAGIAITNNTISNTGDPSATNELQNLSLSGTNLSLSQGGGTVSLATLGRNIMNADLTADASHTQNGNGFGLTLENYNNMFFLTANGAQFDSQQGFIINSDGQNVINSQNSTNQIQAGVMGQDFSTLGQNRITGILGNTMVAHDGSNYIQSIQGDNTFTCDFGNNYINSDNAKNILTAKTGNNIITETGNNKIQSTNGSNLIGSNISNDIVTDEGENVMQATLGGDNIIRNVSGGDLILQCLSNQGSLKILPPSSTYDYAGKWMRCVNNDGTVEYQDLPPAPSGGLQAVSVAAPLTGNGTPLSPITMPAITNFANADLLFTSDRIHNLNGKSLMLQGGTGINFLAQSHHFTGTVSNKFSGPDNQLFSNTANGKNAMFATGGASNYMLVSGTGKNIIQTTASTTKPVGSVLQRKDATSSVEYTDYAMPATASSSDNGKVLTYNSTANTMQLLAPGATVTKPFFKISGNGGQANIGNSGQTAIVNAKVDWDDTGNCIYNLNAGHIQINETGRYRISVSFVLGYVSANTSNLEDIFYVNFLNVGSSTVNVTDFSSNQIRIPKGSTSYNYSYSNIVNVTQTGQIYLGVSQAAFGAGNGGFAHIRDDTSRIIIEKI